MANAYIVGAVRTATGRKNGRLSRTHPVDMGAAVVDELVDRTGVPTDKWMTSFLVWSCRLDLRPEIWVVMWH